MLKASKLLHVQKPANFPFSMLRHYKCLNASMLTTAVFELVQQFYHATEIGSGVQRGANGAPAPGIQGQGASKE